MTHLRRRRQSESRRRRLRLRRATVTSSKRIVNAFARYVTFLCGLASKSFILYPCRVDAEEGEGEGEQGSTGKGKGAMGKRVNEERPGRCRNSGIMRRLSC